MYKRFVERKWFHTLGCSGTVRMGSLILFAVQLVDGSEVLKLGKILGIVERDGTGKLYENARKNPAFAVLVASDDLRAGWVWHVRKSEIRRDVEPNAFMRWFLFGEAPNTQTAIKAGEYGALSANYIADFLTAPEGALTYPKRKS